MGYTVRFVLTDGVVFLPLLTDRSVNKWRVEIASAVRWGWYRCGLRPQIARLLFFLFALTDWSVSANLLA